MNARLKPALWGLCLLSACSSPGGSSSGSGTGSAAVPATPVAQMPGHESLLQDTSHKESPRLVPAEAYMRTYLTIFGGLSALQAQTALNASGTGLFDGWAAYLGALGLPNYTIDLPRKGETNALMVATFERLGVALCDRVVEKDLLATPPVEVSKRLVFTFDVPADLMDQTAFTPRFDQMHRQFLGYPAQLAPTARTVRFFQLYRDTAMKHVKATSRFNATQAGWAAVCYGLVRHPEFHLY